METIYEETRNGYSIKIYPDYYYSETPDDWGDGSVFLVAFHREFTVEREGFEIDVCRAIQDKDSVERDSYEYERAKEIQKEYHVFGLEAYIHSGVSLSLSYEGSYPDRRWDVSQLGLVFVSKKETRMRKTARARALGLLETWNAVLEGSVYGYVVEDETHNTTFNESCGGFIETAYPIEKTSVLQEARSVADYAYKQMLTAHVAKRKAQIKNHVPLLAR